MTLIRTRAALATAITPLTLLAAACGTDQRDGEDKASADPTSTSTAPTTADQPPPIPIDGVDYLAGRAWHQADGDVVELPKGAYGGPVIWNGQLVTSQPWGEATGKMTIFDDAGAQVDEVEDVVGFAVSNDGTILGYTTGTGDLIARWDGGQEIMAEGVVDTAGGESIGGAPVSVIGTAPCEAESGGCLIRVNTYTSGCRGIGSSDVPLPIDEHGSCADEQDGLLSYSDKRKPDGRGCGGIWSGFELDFLWYTCDYRTRDISPDGTYVVGSVDQSTARLHRGLDPRCRDRRSNRQLTPGGRGFVHLVRRRVDRLRGSPDALVRRHRLAPVRAGHRRHHHRAGRPHRRLEYEIPWALIRH